MGDNSQPAATTRGGIRHSGGEIVEVQGGHIVRSTGRKDRHSKVCTAKGPRDRRVRLSAHTAIQFYDVQDRLGYDRPSKAVDWLIKKAKPAIDELAELPPWNPETVTSTARAKSSNQQNSANKNYQFDNNAVENLAAGSGSRAIGGNEVRNLQIGENQNQSNNNSSFLPPSLDSDAIADTIKSFFPMGASTDTPPSFRNYPPDLLSRTSSHSQDLRLSLQSFQEPNFLHQQSQAQSHQSEPMLFSGSGFDGSSAGWEHSHSNQAEIARFQRMVSWNNSTGADTSSGGGMIFGNPQPFFGHNSHQLFSSSQRGPLQSSNSPLFRAWIDQQIDHHQQIPNSIHHQQSAVSAMGIATSSAGFPEFRIPARIQGEDEEHDGVPHKPSSASSDSRR